MLKMEESENETYISGLESSFNLKEGQKIPVVRHYKVNASWYKGRLKSLSLDDLDKLGDDEFREIVYWAVTVLSRKYFCAEESCQIVG